MRINIIFSLLLLCTSLFSQKADVERFFNQAAQNYYYQDYAEARKIALEILKKDSTHVKTHVLLATIYMETSNFETAEIYYKNAIRLGVEEMNYVYYDYANLLFLMGELEAAEELFGSFIENATDEKEIRIAELQKKSCRFAKNALKNPVEFKPENLGPNVNSSYDEYLPSITPDESTLVITRKLPGDNFDYTQQKQEDFYICVKSGKTWSPARAVPGNLNTSFNEGAQTLSADGKVMFFTACSRKEGYGSCDIYYALKYGNNWTSAENAGAPLNTEAWESQPSLASDNKTLYFASNRPGGLGGLDIWKAELQPDGSFSEPVNLGAPVNTEFDESGPFIHPDNKTLYFASNGHPGMGGMDIFYSRFNNEKWNEPVNLGYPINTFDNEASISLNAKGDVAFISSSREGGRGGIDIYSFNLYEEARPVEVTYLKGIVFDVETDKRLGARFELIDLASSEVIVESSSSSTTGEFLVCVPTDKDYALNVSKDGYVFFSENFTFSKKDAENKPYVKDIPLQPIKSGVSIVLKNIFFETNSFDLKDESKAELKKLAEFMNKNPQISIEIAGHTDNVGKDTDNMLLSQNRAKSVHTFLVSNGIDKQRLTYKGYGESKPIDDNETEQGRARNRRTEFVIK